TGRRLARRARVRPAAALRSLQDDPGRGRLDTGRRASGGAVSRGRLHARLSRLAGAGRAVGPPGWVLEWTRRAPRARVLHFSAGARNQFERLRRLTLTDMKRVAITGIGVVSPLGNDAKSTWEAAV